MKAYRLDNSAISPLLVAADIPQPKPAAGEVLIRVNAAGVTTAELSWYPTTHTKSGTVRTGAVPSHEFSGVVAAVGDGAEAFTPGQPVFGMNDWYNDGAVAEYCVAPSTALAPKPAKLTYAEAASVPIPALTAWQGLVDRAKIQPGEHVLIHGAAGAVGVFAVQIARLAGARISATAAASDADFLMGLGAEQVIDYRSTRFETSVPPIDIVFDTVGGETLQRSWSVLKPEGRMVTVVSGDTTDEKVRKSFFIVEPLGNQLERIGELLQQGQLQTVVDTIVPWPQTPEAYSNTIRRSRRGKLVIAVADATDRDEAI